MDSDPTDVDPMDVAPMASTGMLPDYSVNHGPGLYPQASERALLQSRQNIVAPSCLLRCYRLAIVSADATFGRVQRIWGSENGSSEMTSGMAA